MAPKKLHMTRVPTSKLSPSRIRMIAIFDPSADPYLMAQTVLPAQPLLDWIAEERKRTDRGITTTIAMTKLLAGAIEHHPSFNSLVFGGKVYRLRDISITIPFLIPDTDDELMNIVIDNAHQKSTEAVFDEFKAAMEKQQEADASRARWHQTVGPLFLAKSGLLRWIGEKRAFRILYETGLGSNIVLTNASDRGKARMIITKNGLHILRTLTRFYLHGIQDTAVVEDGVVVPKKTVTLSIAFDHRMIDGIQLNRFLETLEQFAADPAAAFAHTK